MKHTEGDEDNLLKSITIRVSHVSPWYFHTRRLFPEGVLPLLSVSVNVFLRTLWALLLPTEFWLIRVRYLLVCSHCDCRKCWSHVAPEVIVTSILVCREIISSAGSHHVKLNRVACDNCAVQYASEKIGMLHHLMSPLKKNSLTPLLNKLSRVVPARLLH